MCRASATASAPSLLVISISTRKRWPKAEIADESLCVASIPKAGLDAYAACLEQGDRFNGVFFIGVDRAIVRSDRPRTAVPMSCTPACCDPCHGDKPEAYGLPLG
jgi:hypothetical protein